MKYVKVGNGEYRCEICNRREDSPRQGDCCRGCGRLIEEVCDSPAPKSREYDLGVWSAFPNIGLIKSNSADCFTAAEHCLVDSAALLATAKVFDFMNVKHDCDGFEAPGMQVAMDEMLDNAMRIVQDVVNLLWLSGYMAQAQSPRDLGELKESNQARDKMQEQF